MAKAQTCIFDDKETSVFELLDRREKTTPSLWRRYRFLCVECGHRVRPHKAGGGAAAHIEHLKLNAACSLSTRPRK
jgi:hypothetical protein